VNLDYVSSRVGASKRPIRDDSTAPTRRRKICFPSSRIRRFAPPHRDVSTSRDARDRSLASENARATRRGTRERARRGDARVDR